jgi:hypothetical protein
MKFCKAHKKLDRNFGIVGFVLWFLVLFGTYCSFDIHGHGWYLGPVQLARRGGHVGEHDVDVSHCLLFYVQHRQKTMPDTALSYSTIFNCYC